MREELQILKQVAIAAIVPHPVETERQVEDRPAVAVERVTASLVHVSLEQRGCRLLVEHSVTPKGPEPAEHVEGRRVDAAVAHEVPGEPTRGVLLLQNGAPQFVTAVAAGHAGEVPPGSPVPGLAHPQGPKERIVQELLVAFVGECLHHGCQHGVADVRVGVVGAWCELQLGRPHGR